MTNSNPNDEQPKNCTQCDSFWVQHSTCANESKRVEDFLASKGFDWEDETFNPSWASDCPEYRLPAEEEVDFSELTLSPEEEEQIRVASEEAEKQHLISIGYLDPTTGEFTDQYYRNADFAYDAAREKRSK